jgi:hypothetical protein
VLGEPISPELALVSPELADAARALLPERPWERFVPPARATEPAVIRSPRSASPELRTVASLPRPVDHRVDAPAHPHEHRPPRRVALKAVLSLAALLGVVHLGAWESGGERLLPADASSAPGQEVQIAAPYPGATYLAPDGTRLTTDAAGAAIEELVVSFLCGRERPVLPSIPIERDGSFSYRGPATAPSGVDLDVSGRFESGDDVNVMISATGDGCPIDQETLRLSVDP